MVTWQAFEAIGTWFAAVLAGLFSLALFLVSRKAAEASEQAARASATMSRIEQDRERKDRPIFRAGTPARPINWYSIEFDILNEGGRGGDLHDVYVKAIEPDGTQRTLPLILYDYYTDGPEVIERPMLDFYVRAWGRRHVIGFNAELRAQAPSERANVLLYVRAVGHNPSGVWMQRGHEGPEPQ